MSGRRGPPDIFQLRRSSDGSDSADVPTDARRSAVLRSCSLITLDEECGLAVTSFESRSRCISRMTERAKSPLRVRK